MAPREKSMLAQQRQKLEAYNDFDDRKLFQLHFS